MNPENKYLETAIQIQRWRDFGSHVFAYMFMNIVSIAIWALKGQGFFWPIYPLLVQAYRCLKLHRIQLTIQNRRFT